MKQLLIHFRHKIGQDESEYKGYVTAVYWNQRKQSIKLTDFELDENDFEGVTYLAIDDVVIFEYAIALNEDVE